MESLIDPIAQALELIKCFDKTRDMTLNAILVIFLSLLPSSTESHHVQSISRDTATTDVRRWSVARCCAASVA